jgi:hypothetical protein
MMSIPPLTELELELDGPSLPSELEFDGLMGMFLY